MVRKTLTFVGALLVAFHIWLFVGQVSEGLFVDFALVTRWLIAAGLVAALLDLRGRGVSMVRGRQAVAIWLLAGLLHGPALARDLDVTAPAMPEVVTTLAQIATGLTVLGGLLLVGLVAIRRRPTSPLCVLAVVAVPAHTGALPPGSYLRFAPRPPPVV